MMPEYTLKALERYALDGVPTGGFLEAVLENNLMEAMGRADENNRAALWEICCYVYNEMPAASHGSPDIVANWLERHAAIRKAEHV